MMSTGPDDVDRVLVLARLIHAAACLGSPVDELVRLALGSPDVLSNAIALAIVNPNEHEGPVPFDLVIDRLRTAHDAITP